MLKKILVVGIIILFLCSSLASGINNFKKDYGQVDIEFNINESLEKVTVCCQTYGFNERSSNQIEITNFEAEQLFNKINEIAQEPSTEKKEKLQREILEIAKEHDLLPEDVSLENFQPKFTKSLTPKMGVTPVNGNVGTAALCNFATAGEGSQFPVIILPRLIPIIQLPVPRVFLRWSSPDGITSTGSYLTNTGFIAGGEQTGIALGFWGIGFSIFLPPIQAYGFFGYALYSRCTAEFMEEWPPNYAPEVSPVFPQNGATNVPISTSELTFEISDENGDEMSYTVTTNPNIGSESGSGKDGIYSIPISGLEGSEEYSWKLEVTDGQKITVETYTFSTEEVAPIVYDPNPEDGERYISINQSSLSFHLGDPQGDLMEYSVETSPDIGSGSGSDVSDGTYSIDISNLDYSQEYKWYVNVTDGDNWKHMVFTFQTEHKMVFNPFEEGWQFRKKITINHTQVESDLENFPFLVSTIDSDLITHAQDDGDDILFMDGKGVSTRQFHEIEYFDGSNGELISWVNSANLSSTQDTILYLYYGNPDTNNQQAPELVWDLNYQGIWHLSEDGTGLRKDSTSNYRHATAKNYDGDEATSNGMIDGADVFDGNNDHLRTGVSFDYECRTVSFWVNSDVIPSSEPDIIITQDSNKLNYGSFKAVIQSDGIYAKAGGEESVNYLFDINLNTWYMVQLVRDYDITKYYVNGNLVGNGESGNKGSGSNENINLVIAANRNYIRHFDGILDEIRVSNIARRPGWILTEYNNQNSPDSFISFGPEETE